MSDPIIPDQTSPMEFSFSHSTPYRRPKLQWITYFGNREDVGRQKNIVERKDIGEHEGVEEQRDVVKSEDVRDHEDAKEQEDVGEPKDIGESTGVDEPKDAGEPTDGGKPEVGEELDQERVQEDVREKEDIRKQEDVKEKEDVIEQEDIRQLADVRKQGDVLKKQEQESVDEKQGDVDEEQGDVDEEQADVDEEQRDVDSRQTLTRDGSVVDTSEIEDGEQSISSEDFDTATSTPDDAETEHGQPSYRTEAQDNELRNHLEFLSSGQKSNRDLARQQERKTAPILSGEASTIFPQFFDQLGLLAEHYLNGDDPRLMLNVNSPWSAFICGSQGSGKSHTLSCILENCLLQRSQVSNVTKPLAGIVFHWDRFTSYGSNQICEAAYLCSAGIPVKVLVSPTNLERMKVAYGNLPGLRAGTNQPVVVPMLLDDEQLDMSKMITLMGLKGKEKDMPLYMEVVFSTLRDMVKQNQTRGLTKKGFDYSLFVTKIQNENFNTAQWAGLNLRLNLLESFMRSRGSGKKKDKWLQALNIREEKNLKQAWNFESGGLTIVDLSCPFVDESVACALFTVCLQLFLDSRGDVSRIIALDEAHKFLTGSSGAVAFTEELLQVIRQQRHLASRVVIATQEPTLSPSLLELCSVTIVHRFTSPKWFKFMQGHIAGLSEDSFMEEDNADDSGERNKKRAMANMFRAIVSLETGEGLLFCPTALIEIRADAKGRPLRPRKLGTGGLRIRTRKRLTADGGQSIMAR